MSWFAAVVQLILLVLSGHRTHGLGRTTTDVNSPRDLTLPNYPGPYTHGADVNFRIQAQSSSQTIRLTVLELDTRPESNGRCRRSSDNLFIYDADHKDGSRRLAKLCGSTIPAPIETTGQFAFVRFDTKQANTAGHIGFRIRVEFIGGPPTAPPPTTTTTQTTTTTAQPTTTTAQPPTTTAQPPTTTAQPPTTTAQPPSTTAQPPTTTAQPPTTTAQPPTTTAQPPTTTAQPPSTTAQPPSTTVEPATTTIAATTTTTAGGPGTPGAWFNGRCGQSKYPDAGERQALPDSRIIGGIDALPHEFPWMVYLTFNGMICGGAIINERWILTAAHCGTITSDLSRIEIYTRGHFREQGDKYSAERVVNNPNFFVGVRNELHNDVALVRTTRLISLSEDVTPVCEPDVTRDYAHQQVVATGWGLVRDNTGGVILSDVLQAASLNVTTNADCDDIWGVVPVTSDMICANDNVANDLRDTCGGDSGGPVVIKDSDGTFRLVGVISWGTRECATGRPGVSARVTEFVDWVSDTIR